MPFLSMKHLPELIMPLSSQEECKCRSTPVYVAAAPEENGLIDWDVSLVFVCLFV